MFVNDLGIQNFDSAALERDYYLISMASENCAESESVWIILNILALFPAISLASWLHTLTYLGTQLLLATPWAGFPNGLPLHYHTVDLLTDF